MVLSTFSKTILTYQEEYFLTKILKKVRREDMLNMVIHTDFYFIVFLYFFFSSNSWNLDKILNFKSWYFTQGLWEMEGMWFWKAFILKLRLFLLRVLPLFFFLFLGIYYLIRSLINDDSKFKKKIRIKKEPLLNCSDPPKYRFEKSIFWGSL